MHNICDDSDSNKKKINRVRIYSRLKFNNYFRECVLSKKKYSRLIETDP